MWLKWLCIMYVWLCVFVWQVFRKLHLGTGAYSTESMGEVSVSHDITWPGHMTWTAGERELETCVHGTTREWHHTTDRTETPHCEQLRHLLVLTLGLLLFMHIWGGRGGGKFKPRWGKCSPCPPLKKPWTCLRLRISKLAELNGK